MPHPPFCNFALYLNNSLLCIEQLARLMCDCNHLSSSDTASEPGTSNSLHVVVVDALSVPPKYKPVVVLRSIHQGLVARVVRATMTPNSTTICIMYTMICLTIQDYNNSSIRHATRDNIPC